jgi:hypothetical protein
MVLLVIALYSHALLSRGEEREREPGDISKRDAYILRTAPILTLRLGNLNSVNP